MKTSIFPFAATLAHKPRREALPGCEVKLTYPRLSGIYSCLDFMPPANPHRTEGSLDSCRTEGSLDPTGEATPLFLTARAYCEYGPNDPINPEAPSSPLEWIYNIYDAATLAGSRRNNERSDIRPHHAYALEIIGPTGSGETWGFRFLESALIVAEVSARFRDVLIMPRPFFMKGQEWEDYLVPAKSWGRAFYLPGFLCGIARTVLEMQGFAFGDHAEDSGVYSGAVEHRFAEVAGLFEMFILFRRQFPRFPVNPKEPGPLETAGKLTALSIGIDSEQSTERPVHPSPSAPAPLPAPVPPIFPRPRLSNRKMNRTEGELHVQFIGGNTETIDRIFQHLRAEINPTDLKDIAAHIHFLKTGEKTAPVTLSTRPILRPKEKQALIKRLTAAFTDKDKTAYPALCAAAAAELCEEDFRVISSHCVALNTGAIKTGVIKERKK